MAGLKRTAVSAGGGAAPKTVPQPGMPSSVGPRPPKVGTGIPGMNIRPGTGSSRNYGKAPPAPPPSPNPFGSQGGGF